MQETTTIEISKENSIKLHNAQIALGKILHKPKISVDKVLSIFFYVKPLELILTEMILEENSSIKFDKKKEKPLEEVMKNGETNSEE